MPNMREVRNRMKSVQDIMKITNAMYLISSSKMKKARKALEGTEEYFLKLQSTIQHILQRSPEFEHIYFDGRPKIPEKEKKRGYIVITADKGMAGAYNHNVIQLAEQLMKKGDHSFLFVVGQVGRQYFTQKKVMIDVEFLYTAQDPTLYRARAIAETVTQLFERGELDEVYIVFTKMVSSMKSEPDVIQLLPLKREVFAEEGQKSYQPIARFYPSPEVVMDYLVPDYLKGLIYGVLVESYTSEQNSRMMAMEAATDSAKDMIQKLSLLYNRARQAAITQEITEIVGGSSTFHQ